MKRVFFGIEMLVVLVSILGCQPNFSSKVEERSTTKSVDALDKTRKLMSSAIYRINIESGIAVNCSGDDVVIDIYNNQTLDMKGSADCGLLASIAGKGEVNVAEVQMDSASQTDDSDFKNSKLYGIISRAPNTPLDAYGNVSKNGAYFKPPRPNILNPMAKIKTLQEFKNTKDGYTEESYIKTDSETDTGTIKIKLNNISEVLPSGIVYDTAPLREGGKVLEYEIITNGFNKIKQKGRYMLYESRRMWMGTNPVVIYKMQLKSQLIDMMDTSDAGLLQTLFTNGGYQDVTVTLTLSKYLPVTDSTDEEEDEEDDEDQDDVDAYSEYFDK